MRVGVVSSRIIAKEGRLDAGHYLGGYAEQMDKEADQAEQQSRRFATLARNKRRTAEQERKRLKEMARQLIP